MKKLLFIPILFLMATSVFANWDSSTDMQTLSVSSAFTQVQNSLKAVDGTSGTAPTTVAVGTTVQFEGSSADANETSLTVTNPTADRTVTIPDVTGTVMFINSAQTVSVDHSFTGNPTFNTGVFTAPDINGGTIDNAQIGGTTATGELIVNDSNDDADGLGSQGTSGQFLMSNGDGVNPSFNDSVRPLTPTTFSAAALTGNVSITSGKRYMGFLTVTSVSGALSITMRFDDDSNSVYSWANEAITFATSPTETITGDDTDTDINIYTTGSNDGVSCTFFIDATPILFDAVADDVAVNGTCVGWDGGNSAQFRALYHDASTLSSFEFYASANNFTGTIELYELN